MRGAAGGAPSTTTFPRNVTSPPSTTRMRSRFSIATSAGGYPLAVTTRCVEASASPTRAVPSGPVRSRFVTHPLNQSSSFAHGATPARAIGRPSAPTTVTSSEPVMGAGSGRESSPSATERGRILARGGRVGAGKLAARSALPVSSPSVSGPAIPGTCGEESRKSSQATPAARTSAATIRSARTDMPRCYGTMPTVGLLAWVGNDAPTAKPRVTA